MPPKRAKKAPTVSKDQGRLNFQRVQKPQTTVSPLVQILSQYQLMIMVTDQLSSADIIHLIATCKETKMYLTDDKTIYANIQENANCDGKGIEARAKCFGHWKGDVTKATVKCGGSKCLPCDDCEAMVCNVSSFLFVSPTFPSLTCIRSVATTSHTWKTCHAAGMILRIGNTTKTASQPTSTLYASLAIAVAMDVCRTRYTDLLAKMRLC
jgi:hypothetical protein